jgi:hypothetical protein
VTSASHDARARLASARLGRRLTRSG